MLRDETQATLNDLIRLCAHAGERYTQAAEEAGNRELRALFQELAAQRRAICEQLRSLDRTLGDLPHERDPDVATARSLFAKLRSKLAADMDRALLQECQETDTDLAERMREALDQPAMPAQVRDAVFRLQCEVTAALGRLAAMRARL